MGVIVITGGSRGIGASAAEHAAQRGMGVVLTYNAYPEAAQAVVQRIEQSGGKAVALKLDVADVSSFQGFRSTLTTVIQEVWGTTALAGLTTRATACSIRWSQSPSRSLTASLMFTSKGHSS